MCALKTFNLDERVYNEFSKHCKKHGISMSKKIDNFIKQELSSIKNQKSTMSPELGDFKLEIERDIKEKDPKMPKPLSNPNPLDQEDHGMGKFC